MRGACASARACVCVVAGNNPLDLYMFSPHVKNNPVHYLMYIPFVVTFIVLCL